MDISALLLQVSWTLKMKMLARTLNAAVQLAPVSVRSNGKNFTAATASIRARCGPRPPAAAPSPCPGRPGPARR